jgi:hypothetical protein
MGIDTLFYRMMVVMVSAFTACACGVLVAPRWLRIGGGIERAREYGVPVWALTVEMITNIGFIICARTYSDYSQRVFDRLWVGCLCLSASLTLTAVVFSIRSTSGARLSMVRMAILIVLNLLGVASIVMRY